MILRLSATAVCLLALGASLLMAQSERAAISGTAHDAVVANAKVTGIEIATNASTSVATNDVGDYTIPNLAVGTYTVRVERDGFRPAQVTPLTLNAAMNARVDVTLELGATQQAVEVQAAAAQLSTEDAKSSATMTNRMVDELPLVEPWTATPDSR
jgi:hypothetical protein